MKEFSKIIAAMAISASGASLAEGEENPRGKSDPSGSQGPPEVVIEHPTTAPGNLPLNNPRHFWQRWSKK